MVDDAEQHDLRHLNFRGTAAPQPHRPIRSVRRQMTPRLLSPPQETELDGCADGFLLWLLTSAGLDASVYRATPLYRRLPACLRALRCETPAAARAAVERQPSLLPVAIDSLLLGVTEFHRDPNVFQTLSRQLPRLGQHAGPIRVLSVSCSIGCELYSAGMLLSEAGMLDACELVGIDCRARALHHAQQGLYDADLLKSLPEPLRDRYFRPESGGWRVCQSLRWRSRWQQQNLFEVSDRQAWDLILWRNTAIYLKLSAARSAWQRLARALRPGGILVTGKAERPQGAISLQRLEACIYLKTAC